MNRIRREYKSKAEWGRVMSLLVALRVSYTAYFENERWVIEAEPPRWIGPVNPIKFKPLAVGKRHGEY